MSSQREHQHHYSPSHLTGHVVRSILFGSTSYAGFDFVHTHQPAIVTVLVFMGAVYAGGNSLLHAGAFVSEFSSNLTTSQNSRR